MQQNKEQVFKMAGAGSPPPGPANTRHLHAERTRLETTIQEMLADFTARTGLVVPEMEVECFRNSGEAAPLYIVHVSAEL